MAQELKAYDLVDIQDYRGEVYLKSEADKVIAELRTDNEKLLTQLEDYVELEKEHVCSNLREFIRKMTKENKELDTTKWCLKGTIESLHKLLKEKQRECRHQKYKRCLAMAKWCEEAYNRECGLNPEEMTNKEFYKQQTEFWPRWNSKWLEIAEKFKEGV